MSRYLPYSPDQGYLVPPRVDEVLEADHLCFFVHRVVERLDLSRFEEAYSAEGGMLYHPSLMLKVWLYGYALGVTSSRRLEQRIREDLAFRYLAGTARPDYWALNAFRRRHGRRSTIVSLRWWSWRGHWGCGNWVRWPSTRPGSKRRRHRTRW